MRHVSTNPRLTTLTEPALDPAQRELWQQITTGRRAAAHKGSGGLVSEEGGLVGPFNAFLRSPSVGGPAAALGEAIRFSSTLDRRTLELITVVVAIHWRADFEFWAHRRYAIEAGVSPALLDSMVSDGALVDARPGDGVLVASISELLRTGRLTDDAYAALHGVLGDAGTVDAIAVAGYYSLVSFTLNAFGVPAPVSSAELWGDAPATAEGL
jgi:4-carboxymuconolactone decarboxylase